MMYIVCNTCDVLAPIFLVAHFIKYIDVIPSAFLQFLISALCVFTISTVLSYITYPIECYILNKLTLQK